MFNIMTGERYKMASKQTKALLKGEYGRTIKPFNRAVQKKVLGKENPITCRPADLLKPQFFSKR